MGVGIYKELRDALRGSDVPAGDRMLLLTLAETSRDSTREAWAGQEDLIAATGLKKTALKDTVKRLEATGWLVRRVIGVDVKGRPIYAHRGAQTTYVLPARQAVDNSAEGVGFRPTGVGFRLKGVGIRPPFSS